MGDIECSKCGKSTAYGYIIGTTCLACFLKAKTVHTSTPKKTASSGRHSSGGIMGMTYPSYTVDETIEVHTWGGTSTKISLADTSEAEAEKTEYKTLHEDLRNLRDQSKLSALKELHESLSAEHDYWVKKYADDLGSTNASNYVSGVIGGVGEAMHKIAQMIEVIENDA